MNQRSDDQLHGRNEGEHTPEQYGGEPYSQRRFGPSGGTQWGQADWRGGQADWRGGEPPRGSQDWRRHQQDWHGGGQDWRRHQQDWHGSGQDWRRPFGESNSPHFPEGGFNRGYYEDSPARFNERDRFSDHWWQQRAHEPQHAYEQQRAHEPRVRRYPLGPKGYQRSDERIREDISERLMASFHIDSSEVTVQVLSGRVGFEGTVPDRYMKHAIEDIADSVPGVHEIDNRVRVVGFGRGIGAGAPGAGTSAPGVGAPTTATGVTGGSSGSPSSGRPNVTRRDA